MLEKKLMSIILFISLLSISYSDFYITKKQITIELEKNGDADVVEKISLLVRDKPSLSSYISGLEKPTLAEWQKIVGSEDIRLHVDRNYVDVLDLNIRPQPLYSYNPLNEVGKGEIIIRYRVKKYEGIDDSGLFKLVRIKPRTYQLILNEKALSFKRTSAGNLIIDDKTTLTIIPPEGSLLIDVNPIPPELKETEFPVKVEKISWNDVLLVSPSLVFQYEEGIGDEIYRFFEEETKIIISFINTKEGLVILTFMILLLIFYAQLTTKLRKMRER